MNAFISFFVFVYIQICLPLFALKAPSRLIKGAHNCTNLSFLKSDSHIKTNIRTKHKVTTENLHSWKLIQQSNNGHWKQIVLILHFWSSWNKAQSTEFMSFSWYFNDKLLRWSEQISNLAYEMKKEDNEENITKVIARYQFLISILPKRILSVNIAAETSDVFVVVVCLLTSKAKQTFLNSINFDFKTIISFYLNSMGF